MKCQICNKEIKVSEMVHEIPNQNNEMILMCDHCYIHEPSYIK